jgi:hypothetical protein
MITLETTSEKISAWFRNEGRCAKVLSSPIMSCELFASATPLSKHRSAPSPAQTGQLKAPSVPERRQHATYVKGRVRQALVLR